MARCLYEYVGVDNLFEINCSTTQKTSLMPVGTFLTAKFAEL